MGRVRKFIVGLVAAILAITGWVLLAPKQAPGGSAFYLVPSGTSMLPNIHRGDLVIVREAARYSVGDVAAYESRDLGEVVLHRIVGREGGSLVFKGDNNDWLDTERPSEDQLIGKLWVRVPGAGRALEWMRQPQNAAVVGTVGGLALTVGLVGKRFRRRGRRRRQTENQASPPSSSATASYFIGRGLLALFLIVSLGSMALAVVSFGRPLTRTATTDHPYRQTATFAYSSEATPGAVYPDGVVSTGDPVYLRLADSVRIDLRYGFAADTPHAVSGTVTLQARLQDDSGWERLVEMGPGVPFSGDEATVSGVLDLVRLRRLMTEVDDLTGVTHASFALVVAPEVEVSGVVAGERFNDSFSPTLEFVLDPLILQVRLPQDPTVEVSDLVSHEAAGSVSLQEEEPGTLSLWMLTMEVAAARRTAVIGGIIAAVIGLALVLVVLHGRRRDEPSRIQARYGRRVIPMRAPVREMQGAIVDVASMDALARVAETYERMILHGTEGSVHSYIVEGDVVVYRYRTDGVHPAKPGFEPKETQPPPPPPRKSEEPARARLFGRSRKRKATS